MKRISENVIKYAKIFKMNLERFLNKEEAAEFRCMICFDIPMDPTIHDKCQNIICEACHLKSPSINCPCGLVTDQDPLTLVKMTRREKRYHGLLQIQCYFCLQGVTLNEWRSHSKECSDWPEDLIQRPVGSSDEEVISKGDQIILVSDPPSGERYERPYRKVEYFHNGKRLRGQNNRVAGHVEIGDSLARLYFQVSRLLPDVDPNDITLVQSQHSILESKGCP